MRLEAWVNMEASVELAVMVAPWVESGKVDSEAVILAANMERELHQVVSAVLVDTTALQVENSDRAVSIKLVEL